MKEYALIVAGGIGTRMKSDIPKQFLEINGEPVLMHTLRVFHEYSENIEIILVLPPDSFATWNSLCEKHDFQIAHELVEGGITRFQSVKNGLSTINDDDGIVAIHDGVRPLIRKEIIGASFRLAEVHGSAIASVRLKESIRRTDQDLTRAVDRSKFRLIQTPQTFMVRDIRKAYELPEEDQLTDDASVAERAGIRISLFEGDYENIKITTPEDLRIAEALLTKKG